MDDIFTLCDVVRELDSRFIVISERNTWKDPPFKLHQEDNVLFAEQAGSRSAAQIKAFETTWQSAALWSVNPGVRAENVITFGLSLPPSMKSSRPGSDRSGSEGFGSRLNSVPGMRAVSNQRPQS